MPGLQQSNGTRLTHFVHRDGYAEPVYDGFSFGFLLAGPFWFLRRREWQPAAASALGIVAAYALAGDVAVIATFVAGAAAANWIHQWFLLRRGYSRHMPPGWSLAELTREPVRPPVILTYTVLTTATAWYTYHLVNHATALAQQLLNTQLN